VPSQGCALGAKACLEGEEGPTPLYLGYSNIFLVGGSIKDIYRYIARDEAIYTLKGSNTLGAVEGQHASV